MNRYVLRLLVVMAVIAVAGFTRLSAGQAEETGGVGVDQSNVQVAINVAIYCPDVTQTIDQFALNITVVDVEGDLSNVGIDQTNVQIAYNLALYSPGATQVITQQAGNGTAVTTTSDAAVTIDQFNGAAAGSISFASDGTYQTIVQEAANEAIVATGSETLGAAVGVVITQENVAYALNVCFSGYILGDGPVPALWEECAPEWWWSDPSEAPEAWDAGWWETDAPMTWEEWFAVWDEWWASGAPGWDACLAGTEPTPTATPTSSGPDSSGGTDSSVPDTTVVPTGSTGTTGGTTSGGQVSTNEDCIGGILAGYLPPSLGGFGTFAFAGCDFEELLTTSGCDETTSVFFYNLPSGSFAVWIPGAEVAAVNEAILALFPGATPIPEGTIFTARCS